MCRQRKAILILLPLGTMVNSKKTIATMKNLFTKMVLVAVAAMGMLACQNEPETVVSGNDNAQKTTIEVIADLENTRSAFGEKGGDGAYASVWQGGEQVKAAVVTYNSNYSYGDVAYYEVDESDVATVTATGSVAQFSLTFDYLSATSGTLLITSPAGSVDFDTTNYYYDGDEPGFVVTIPTEQTPLAASVDPAAHILTATYTGSFANAIKPEWEHAAAYAKMTLKNFDAEIDNVVVTIDSKKYTLNPDNVEGNVFWFACEANEAPSTVKVTVNTTDEKAYIKTLDLTAGNGMGLPFAKGNVAEFSVNMDGITPDEGGTDVGSSLDFTGAYMWDTIAWNAAGYFKITSSTNAHGSSSYVYIYLNEADRPNNNSIKPGTYTAATNDKTPDVGYFCARVGASGSAAFWSMYESALPAGATLVVNYYDGKYQILFTKSATESHGYEGFTEGWVAPGTGGGEEPDPDPVTPVQLAAPTNLSATATTNTATISWNAVDNASSYDVTVGITTKNVTTTTATFDGLTPDATYEVSVVAVGDGTNYTTSPAATTTVKTLAEETGGDDPGVDVVGFTKVNLVSVSKASYYGRQYDWMASYVFDYDGATISFDICDFNNSTISFNNSEYGEGTYTNNGNGANMDTKELYNISVSGLSGNTGSTVEIIKTGDIYTIKMTLITGAGTYKLYYQGTI